MPDNINGYTQQTDSNGTTTWQNANNQVANGWQSNQNDWYYFNKGQATTNWQYVNNNWYYLNPQSSVMETGLQQIDNATYYLNENHDGTYGAMRTGWQSVNNNWYYFATNGAAQTGWQWLNDNWFYFDPTSGIMQTGLKQVNTKYYYLREQPDHTYGAMQTGWQYANNGWYYLANDGAAQTGWQWLNNNWFYFDPTTATMQAGLTKVNDQDYYLNDQHDGNYGAMRTGWQYVGGNWYNFADNGAAQTGWQWLNNNWFYFSPTTATMQAGLTTVNDKNYYLNDQHDGNYGAMRTGWQFVNNSWYYLANDGSAQTGWQWLNNWYYFNATGAAQTGAQTINGRRYYFDPTNAWALRGWHYLNNHWYYFEPDNAWLMTGWTTVNGAQYYLDPTSGQMAAGITKIGDHTYYFEPASGHQIKGFFLDPTRNQLKYFDATTGVMPSSINVNWAALKIDPASGNVPTAGLKNGINQIGNSLFYVTNGTIVNNSWQRLNNAWYYFGDNGVAQTGWYRSAAGNWYYFNQDGTARTGWQSINGRWYLFDNTNANAYTGWYHYNNSSWYYFDPTNAWADTGWQYINGYWYYFNQDAVAVTGWQSINGRWYLFDNTNANAYTSWYQSGAGNWYYFDPTNAWADTGWQYLNGTWYYFDPTNAWMDLNQTLTYNWQQVMGQYWNSSSIAIQLQRDGSEYATTNNPGLRYETASTVKVAVLAMLLHNTNGNLDGTQQSLAMRMIRNSDNDATTAIVNNYLGGMYALSSIYGALGMSQTSASSWWGTTLTVPTDQLKLLNMIYLDSSSNYLNQQSKNYIQWLMGSVSSGQRWGISAGSNSYYLKNGWRPASDNGLWEVHSIGYIPNGINSYTIAVYTRNNRDFNWGVDYVEALARITKKIIG